MTTEQRVREPFGLFYAWWRGDTLPALDPLDRLEIELVVEPLDVAPEIGQEPSGVASRAEQGHQLYVARIRPDIAGWGWSASKAAEIGELGISMTMPPANRYLWDFVTLPEWRGRGIYPTIIQEMIRQQPDIERFWIGHDYGNVASGKGILRAGFALVGELYVDGPESVLVPVEYPERTAVAAGLLGVELASSR